MKEQRDAARWALSACGSYSVSGNCINVYVRSLTRLVQNHDRLEAENSELREGLLAIADELERCANSSVSEWDCKGLALACRGYAMCKE